MILLFTSAEVSNAFAFVGLSVKKITQTSCAPIFRNLGTVCGMDLAQRQITYISGLIWTWT